jgi:hypothetical protein
VRGVGEGPMNTLHSWALNNRHLGHRTVPWWVVLDGLLLRLCFSCALLHLLRRCLQMGRVGCLSEPGARVRVTVSGCGWNHSMSSQLSIEANIERRYTVADHAALK